MAKKKQAGKLKQQKRPNPKYLGVKVQDGQSVGIGSILIRQRGTRYAPGQGVKVGRDHTLFAIKEGKVKFEQKAGKTHVAII